MRGCPHHRPWSCPMLEGIVPWSHFMITIIWSAFLKKCILKPLGPQLGVNWTWTKRSDHSSKVYVLIFLYMSKKGSFGNFLHVWSSPLLLPFFLHKYEKSLAQNTWFKILKRHFFVMVQDVNNPLVGDAHYVIMMGQMKSKTLSISTKIGYVYDTCELNVVVLITLPIIKTKQRFFFFLE